MKISVIVPAYNAKKYITNTVSEIDNEVKKLTKDYEIIIVDNGSVDGTPELVKKLSKKNKRIVHLVYEKPLGKGGAVNEGIKHTKNDIIAVIDQDSATKIEYLKPLIGAINNGADISIGSRLSKGSKVKRSLNREIFSRGYNFLVRFFLKSSIKDHQCGFKAYKKDVILDLLKVIKDKQWFWDTEMLVRAQQKGYKIVEIPVEWSEAEGSTMRLKRDIARMGRELIKFWWGLGKG